MMTNEMFLKALLDSYVDEGFELNGYINGDKALFKLSPENFSKMIAELNDIAYKEMKLIIHYEKDGYFVVDRYSFKTNKKIDQRKISFKNKTIRYNIPMEIEDMWVESYAFHKIRFLTSMIADSNNSYKLLK